MGLGQQSLPLMCQRILNEGLNEWTEDMRFAQ